MTSNQLLLRRIKRVTLLFIVGLVLSGATAIPLESGLEWMVKFTGARQLIEPAASSNAPDWAQWLVKVQSAVNDTVGKYPFMAYGTDWLAFGHFAIAVAFIGALRDPVRNVWLYTFGMIACGMVVPYALVFGAVRGIPIWWRLIDCSFGMLGFIPLWYCRKWTERLAEFQAARS